MTFQANFFALHRELCFIELLVLKIDTYVLNYEINFSWQSLKLKKILIAN